MTELSSLIRCKIRENGPLSVSEYMSLCLGHPEFGYYMTRQAFGSKGDFITSPEISQLFGEMLAIWVMMTWRQMGAPQPIQLIELGPGQGTLMKDIWRGIAALPELRSIAQIHLVEFSPRLQQVQSQTLAGLPVTWHSDLSTLPEKPSLIIANEFFDALPIEQTIFEDDAWHQRVISLKQEEFVFSAGKELKDLPADKGKNGAIFEFSPSCQQVMLQLCRFLKRNGGALIAIDYGDDVAPETRFGETLQAVYQHKPLSVFENIGHSDLTAHVAFAPLRKIAAEQNCAVLPVVTQREFLTQMGIRLRADTLAAKASPAQIQALQSGLERLVHPDQMGDLFKVLQVFSHDS